MRKLIVAGAALVALSGCATMPKLDICKFSSVRRAAYTTAIQAADAYVISGRPVPSELLLGRQAAVTALGVLDHNCPPPRPG